VSNPKPVQQPHPPVIMGGDGPTTFDRVIQFCDGWMPISRGGVLPPGFEEKIRTLRQRAESAGRDPESISVSLFGTPTNRETLDEMARIGVDRAILSVPARAPAEAWAVLDEH